MTKMFIIHHYITVTRLRHTESKKILTKDQWNFFGENLLEKNYLKIKKDVQKQRYLKISGKKNSWKFGGNSREGQFSLRGNSRVTQFDFFNIH